MTRTFAALSWAAFLAGCIVVSVDTMSRSATLPVGAALMLAATLVTMFVHGTERPSAHWIGGATVAIVAPFVLAHVTSADAAIRSLGGAGLVAAGAAHLVRELREASRRQTELEARSHRDDLTELPDRDLAISRLDEALEASADTGRSPSAIRIDLDRFTQVNDRLGHHGANFVLRTIADRIDEVARDHAAVACRLMGDDFVVAGATSSITSWTHLGDELRRRISQPITVGGQVFEVTACCGVAVSPPERRDTAEQILLHADIATRRAKGAGVDTTAVFDDSMYEDLHRRTELEVDLRGAIGRGELELAYQPIIEIGTGRLSGFEALLRWTREDGTHVSPAEFVPLAEDLGLIGPIGAWAMERALRDLAAWTDAGIVDQTASMSVNVSPRQVVEPDCVEMVQRALERSGIAAHRLWIEITESMMLAHPELARATLRDLRALGVGVALDDFGTGYSSLSLLQQFPLQRIKIDRAFVDGIGDRAPDRALVRTILAMAATLELDVVAEGIENVHQLLTLRDMHCEKGQGFLISRPVPNDRIEQLVRDLVDFARLPFFADDGSVRAIHAEPVGDPAAYLDGDEPSEALEDATTALQHRADHEAGWGTIGVSRFGVRVTPERVEHPEPVEPVGDGSRRDSGTGWRSA